MDEAGSGDQAFILVIVFGIPVQMGDIGSDEHEVTFFYEVDLVADEAGAFCFVDEHEFVFLMKVPGLVEIITFPVDIYKGRIRR